MAGLMAPSLSRHPAIEKLNAIREQVGQRKTTGLTDEIVARFYDQDPTLRRALDEAGEIHATLRDDFASEQSCLVTN